VGAATGAAGGGAVETGGAATGGADGATTGGAAAVSGNACANAEVEPSARAAIIAGPARRAGCVLFVISKEKIFDSTRQFHELPLIFAVGYCFQYLFPHR